MWLRIEGSNKPCRCGGEAEMWARFTEGKRAIRILFCPTCYPHLAKLVSRERAIASSFPKESPKK